MKALLAVLVLIAQASLAAATEPITVAVWPGEVPGETKALEPEGLLPAREGEKPVQRLANVARPTLTIYRAAGQRPAPAVLICPGGGYHILAMDLEGSEVAAWLNSIGVTGVVLKYRVPRRESQPKHQAPLQDAQRAMGLLRSRAAEWGIDPQRIGILGFSAGGHLAATAATNFDRRQYPAIDAADEASCRPDFAVLVYPAYLVEEDALAAEIRVSAQTPPTLLVHAADDRIGPENSVRTYLALKEAGVPAELHVFATGGHGFGLRPSQHPISGWPRLAEAWFRARGVLPIPAESGGAGAANNPS